MNFFEFFKIAYVTHFILGAYLSLLLWRFLPAAVAPLFQQTISPSDAIISITISAVTLSWYFVWYGSIIFALYGRFPILSPRAFSILLGLVYSGFVSISYIENAQAMNELIVNNPIYAFTFGVILSVSASGAIFLPGLKLQFDEENDRLAKERDRYLDELNPWNTSTSSAHSHPTNNPTTNSNSESEVS